MDSSAGFFFSFDAPAKDGAGSAPTASSSSGTATAWQPPSISTTQFPWVEVDDTHLAQWAALYCKADSPQSPPTKPRQLAVSLAHTEGTSAPSFTLCYQTSPEVHTLTSVDVPAGAAATEHRDVIPGRYYGGLKVWSCATLLAEYLGEHAAHYSPLFRAAGVVVELGCGQGLPGLAALCLGARSIAFQDYNAEVLEVCTKPNLAATVAANRPSLLSPLRVKFVHGDWVDLRWEEPQDTPVSPAVGGSAATCDVILGADVTFDKEACDKLACVLQRWLRPDTGEALIASKDYYFGTNGGYLEFTRSAEAQGLAVTLLRRVDTADKMPHVVLRVTHRTA